MRLPEAVFAEPAALPEGRNKAFGRSAQAFCALRASNLRAPNKQSARTEQARRTDGACMADAPSMPKVPFRPLSGAFCKKPVSAKTSTAKHFESILRIIRTIGFTSSAQAPPAPPRNPPRAGRLQSTTSPFSVAELLSVILTRMNSPTRCVPRSNTTTRFCSVRP